MPTIEQSSFTLGNNSYAGCDIKAVVHLYQDEFALARANAQKERYEYQIRQANEEIASLRRNIATLVGFNLANPERMEFLNVRIQSQEQFIAGLQRSIEELNKTLTGEVISTKVLAEIQTLSVSTFREKQPVRALGSVYPRGFTRGARSIAGSMIFTVFDRNVLHSILNNRPDDPPEIVTTALIDQLPPFDITVAFANEYGHTSRMAILGCEFVSEGQVMSVEDMITENQAQFVARDIDPMRPAGEPRSLSPAALARTSGATPASSLVDSDELYRQYRAATNPWVRTRRNRFI